MEQYIQTSNEPSKISLPSTSIRIKSILDNAEPIKNANAIDEIYITSFNIFKFTIELEYQQISIEAIKFYLLKTTSTWQCTIQLFTETGKNYLDVNINKENYSELYDFFSKYADRIESPDIKEEHLLNLESWRELKKYKEDNTYEIYQDIHNEILLRLKNELQYCINNKLIDSFEQVIILEIGGGNYPNLMVKSCNLASEMVTNKKILGVFTDLFSENVEKSSTGFQEKKTKFSIEFHRLDIAEISEFLKQYASTNSYIILLSSGAFNQKVNSRKTQEKVSFATSLWAGNVNCFISAGKTLSHATAHLFHAAGFEIAGTGKIEMDVEKKGQKEKIYSVTTSYHYRRLSFEYVYNDILKKSKNGCFDLSLKPCVFELLEKLLQENKKVVGVHLNDMNITDNIIKLLSKFDSLKWVCLDKRQNKKLDGVNYFVFHKSSSDPLYPLAVSSTVFQKIMKTSVPILESRYDIQVPEPFNSQVGVLDNIYKHLGDQQKLLIKDILVTKGFFISIVQDNENYVFAHLCLMRATVAAKNPEQVSEDEILVSEIKERYDHDVVSIETSFDKLDGESLVVDSNSIEKITKFVKKLEVTTSVQNEIEQMLIQPQVNYPDLSRLTVTIKQTYDLINKFVITYAKASAFDDEMAAQICIETLGSLINIASQTHFGELGKLEELQLSLQNLTNSRNQLLSSEV